MAKYYTNGSSALAPKDPRKKFQVISGGKDNSASRPNFQVINGGKAQQVTKPQPHAGLNALRESEKSAIGQNYGRKTFYRGNGKNIMPNKSTAMTKFLGSKKTLGATLSIIFIIGAIIIFLSSSHSLLGPAIMNNFTQQATGKSSFVSRALHLMGYSTTGSAVTTDDFPASKKYATMSNSFKKRLTQQGFTVSGNNNNISVSFKGQTIAADDWSNFYRTNAEGRTAFNNARLTSASNFYDDSANQTLRKFGLDRNIYKSYKQTGNREVDLEHFDETMIDRLDTSGPKTDVDGTNQGKKQLVDENGPVFDENGNPVLVDADDVTSSAHADSNSKITEAEARTKASSFIGDVAGKVQQVTNWSCTALKIGNLIAVAVAANEIYQSINFTMGLNENGSKMQAGFGDQSAYMAFMNLLTTPASSKVEDYAHADINGKATEDSQGSLEITVGEKEENDAPINADGVQLMLTGKIPNRQNTENYSLERATNVLGKALATSTSAGVMNTCAVAQGSVALISLAVSLVPGVGQVHIAGQFLFKLGSGILVTTAMAAFLKFMIPTVMKLYLNTFLDAKGLAGGHTYAKGEYAALSRLDRTASAQMVASEEMVNNILPLRNEMAALEADSDRRNRSPFDITSRNTFLGSIAYDLFPLLYRGNTSSVNTLLTTTSRSIASLGGQAQATTYNNSSYITQHGSCPNLEGIGVVGDIYCNPIVVTDVSTIDVKPNDPEYAKALEDQFEACDEEGDCEIKENSELAKYVTFCTNRDSPFGVVDSNILNELSKVGGVAAVFFGSLPIIGDLLDLITAAEDIENMRWATGEKCVASEKNPDWPRFKYFQRYIEDMRLIEQVSGFSNEDNDKSEDQGNTETSDTKVNEEHTTITIPGLKNKYKIAWVSDLHMIADGTDYVDQARYDMFKTPDGVYSVEYLNSIIDHLNNGNFDAVIFGGDMIDYYSTKNYETLRAGLAKLNMPWFYIYGSEDHDKYTGRTNDSVAGDLSSDSAAGSGDVIDLGELKIVGLNNSSNAKIGSSDLNSVANNIQNAGKPVLLATHVPFASKINNDSLKNSISNAHNGQAYYWTDDSSNWELSDNQAMQSFLNDNIYNDDTNVKGVFAGHVHTLSNDTKLTDNINQHIFKGSFGGSIGVIDVVGDNTAQTNIVDYDIPNRNPVTAYLEKYEAEHPLDNSPAGYLARISGMTKDDATLVLDIAAYYNFVDNYDASTRLAMNGDASDIKTANIVVAEAKSQRLLEHPMIGDGESAEEYIILISQTPVYADIRNRSYAA